MNFARACRLLLGASTLLVAGSSDAQVRREYSAVHMGVPVRMILHAPSDVVAGNAARAAFARIAELDDKMSDYRPQSEVRLLSARVIGKR
jgi:thiamine biosynthesis lipoprotein